MRPDPRTGGGPRLLLMVGVPPLGPLPQRTSLRSALRSGRAARAWHAASAAPAPDYEPFGRSGALEEG